MKILFRKTFPVNINKKQIFCKIKYLFLEAVRLKHRLISLIATTQINIYGISVRLLPELLIDTSLLSVRHMAVTCHSV